MAISRWQPADDLSTMHSMMDRMFGDLFEGADTTKNTNPMRRLPVDISETNDAYVIKAPVPGFKPEDVDVTFTDGVLSIRARHREEKQDKEGSYLRRELMFGDYQRHIVVPGDVRADDIRASFENGLLTVELPRAPRPQPKKIEVKGSESRRQQKELTGASNAGGKRNS